MRLSAGERTAGGGSEALFRVLTTGEASAVSTIWFDLPGLTALRGLCTTMQTLARTLGGDSR